MNKRFLTNILLFVAMGLGLLTGWLDVSFLNKAADITSNLFLRLLKMVSVPIIFLAVTATITGMKNFQEMRRMGRKVLMYTLLTTVIAATTALVLYLLIDPASAAMGIKGKSTIEGTKQASYLSFILNIIPSNIFEAFATANVMAVVFVAIVLSISILFLPEEQKTFLNKLFSSLFAAMIKLTGFVIALMPIAIWAFMTLLVRDLSQNFSHFSRLLLYLGVVVGANFFQGLVVLPIFLKIKKVPILKTVKGMMPALTVAFFSKSSNATLPIAMKSVEENLGVSKQVSGFSLPLCSVINMNGCAAFILTTTLFVSTVNGFSFTTVDYIGWIFLATMAAVGNAGVPMGCFFLTSAFLIGMDVPLFMMGLILPFYTIMDMIETTLNIWSDGCITVTVDKELAALGQPSTTFPKEFA